MSRAKAPVDLTTADLVVLLLLFERPMHGYELVHELEQREVTDWAELSRPQVYYSMAKLKRAGLLVAVRAGKSLGPRRQVYRPSPSAAAAFEAAVGREGWATMRVPPPFLTWAVLATSSPSPTIARVIAQRQAWLQAAVEKGCADLAAIGPTSDDAATAVAKAIVQLTVAQHELELKWLPQLEQALTSR
jgi:DNA-binding PadR family transcriptional regulator